MLVLWGLKNGSKAFHKILPWSNTFVTKRPGWQCRVSYVTLRKQRAAVVSIGSDATKLSESRDSHITTSQSGSLVEAVLRATPTPVQPYLRLIRFDKPIGTWLLFWPCAWSITLAAGPGSLPDLYLMSLFFAGSFIMRGAGCIINDLWDQKLDRQVVRTRGRPLASGELSNMDAMVFLSGQLSLGLMILLQLNWYSVVLGTASMLPVICYPLMKRVTYWPQLVLGITFNWGALLGFAAVNASCDWSVCLPLFAAATSWTIVYDTIYAHQDKYDDMKIGVKSTALRMGEETRKWLMGFSGVMLSGLCVCGLTAHQTLPYFMATGLVGAHLARQLYTLDINDPDDCGKKFRENRHIGLLLFLGILCGNFWKNEEDEEETVKEI